MGSCSSSSAAELGEHAQPCSCIMLVSTPEAKCPKRYLFNDRVAGEALSTPNDMHSLWTLLSAALGPFLLATSRLTDTPALRTTSRARSKAKRLRSCGRCVAKHVSVAKQRASPGKRLATSARSSSSCERALGRLTFHCLAHETT